MRRRIEPKLIPDPDIAQYRAERAKRIALYGLRKVPRTTVRVGDEIRVGVIPDRDEVTTRADHDATDNPICWQLPNSERVFTSSEDCQSIAKKKVEEAWVRWIRRFHWDYFITPSFRFSMDDETVREIGERYVRQIGPEANAFMGWGGNQSHSFHLLLNTGHNQKATTGLDKRKLMKKRLEGMWNDFGATIKVEVFDGRRASRAVRYFADHHEVGLIGTPVIHRVRK